jgi:hypothetical protein
MLMVTATCWVGLIQVGCLGSLYAVSSYLV